MKKISKVFLSILIISLILSFAVVSEAATTKVTNFKAANTTTGVKLSWTKLSGASKYRLYYKVSTAEKYTKIGDTTSTSYTVKNLTSGTKYTFCIKGYLSKTKKWTDNVTVSITFLSAPKISKAETVASNQIKVTWGKVTGATKYRVYYKRDGDSSYTKYGDTKGTSLTIKNYFYDSTKYYFTVKAYGGNSWSSNTAYSVKTNLSSIGISSVQNQSYGVKITWSDDDIYYDNSGSYYKKAQKYRIYYRVANEKTWVNYEDVANSESSCIIDGLKVGTQYIFAVKSYNGSMWSILVPSNAITRCSSSYHSYSRTNTTDCLKSSATCTSPAIYYQKCRICGDIGGETYSYGDALNHTYDDGVITIQPGCDTEGAKTYTCKRCAFTKTESIAAVGHDYRINFEYDDKKHWTECIKCGEVNEEYHKYYEYETVKERTCTTDGEIKYICSCGYTFIQPEYAYGHNWGNWAIVKEATCTTPATYCYSCYDCGELGGDTWQDGNLAPHNYDDNVVIYQPTCTNAGTKISVCKTCGQQTFEAIAPTGHTWSEWKSNETNHWRECTECGETDGIAEHSFGTWETIDSTDEVLKQERTCMTCNYKEEQDASNCVHQWNKISETQTCPSIITYQCSLCKEKKTEKLAHYNLGKNTVYWSTLVYDSSAGLYINPYTGESTEKSSSGYFCRYCYKRCAT